MKNVKCILIVTLLWLAAAALPANAETVFFEDDFLGTALDSAKWNTENAVTSKRWCSTAVGDLTYPGNWQDVSSVPCNGYTQSAPYGYITVANGEATFASDYRRTFPYIWAGPPSRVSPFPKSGDFTLEIRMKYNSIQNHGDGLLVRRWGNSDPAGNNPPGGEGGILGIWADYTVRSTCGNLNYSEYYVYHTYRLEYRGGKYYYYLDGVLRNGPIASSIIPDTIWIGNPVFTHWNITDWSDFTIDYIRVTTPNAPPVCNLHDILSECSGPDGTAITLQADCTDPDGDPLSITWNGSFGAVKGENATVKFPYGSTAVTLSADDGNGGTFSGGFLVTLQDTIPPSTSMTITGESGSNGWFVSPVIVDLVSTDNCTGCNRILGILDGNTFVFSGAQGNLSVTDDGIHSLTAHGEDNAGNVEETKSAAIKIDQTAPVIEISGIADGASYPACNPPIPGYSVTDNLSGVSSSGAETSGGPIGSITYVVTASDYAGNDAAVSATYNVLYSFNGTGEGFQHPVILDRPFKLGSTIPVKFRITDGCGGEVTGAKATLKLVKLTNNTPDGEQIDATSNVPGQGNAFRYDNGSYIYNLSTNKMGAGSWRLIVTIDGGQVETTDIVIK